MLYKNVKRYYAKGWYTKEEVASFVLAGLLSPKQYKEIVGEAFTSDGE